MTEDLADLLGTQETACLEFKRESTKANRDTLRKAICAMANDMCQKGGGDILIGATDDGDPVEDADTSDDALLALMNIRNEGRILNERRIAFHQPFDSHPVQGSTLDDLDLERFKFTYLPATVDRSVLGYVNRFGRGIGRMRDSMDLNSNPAPDFEVDDSSWTVTLRLNA